MKDDQLDQMVRNADVYRPAVIGQLDGVAHSLLEEIMSIPTVPPVDLSSPDPAPAPRRSRRLRALQGAVAAFLALSVAALGAFLMRPSPAFAVEDRGNGLVRIEIKSDFRDPTGLERTLRDTGMDVKVLTVRQDGCGTGRLAALSYGYTSKPWSPGGSSNPLEPVTWHSKNSYTLDTKKLLGALRLYVTAPDGIPFSKVINRPDKDDVQGTLMTHLGDFACFEQDPNARFKIEKDHLVGVR